MASFLPPTALLMGVSVVLPLPALAFLASIHGVLATATPFLLPSFHFGYSDNSSDPWIPVTGQCDRINLVWSRGANDTGPSPVAPYFFQVYTSTSETPYVVYAGFGSTFEWDVPFAPNTLYQICMFDSNGFSGGCRATHTVVANTTVTTPKCQNVTAPSELSVSGTVPLGVLSKYSYIDQCTSLSVTPKTGKPPFTLTVAPSSHPPFNLTSHTMDPISWQVSLPQGYHFFLSLSSSDGLIWGNGPMRVGGLGPTTCLAPGTISQTGAVSMVVGTGIGGAVLGMIIGVWAYILFLRVRRRRQRSSSQYPASQPFPPTKPYEAPSAVPTPPSAVEVQAGPYHPPSSPTINPESTSTSLEITRPSSYNSSFLASYLTPSVSTHTARTARDLPVVPLEPLRHNRQRSSHRSVPEPSIDASSDSGSVASQNHFPLDRKMPLRPFTQPDDAASVVSSSSNARTGLGRSPTYASSRHPHGVYVIQETEVSDVPPEYGRHTDDTSCTPSIISSGRFPSSYVSSDRF